MSWQDDDSKSKVPTPGLVDEMRKHAILVGKLSDWHRKNLQNFAFIAFDNLQTVEIDYDLKQPSTEGGALPEEQTRYVGYVTYRLIRKPGKRIMLGKVDMGTRTESIARWVRDMLWKDVKVEIWETSDKGRTKLYPVPA